MAAARSRRSELRGRVPAGVRSWDDAVAASAPLPAGHPLPDVDDTAVLLYTGGTTGTPKAVRLTHANLRSNAQMSLAWASQVCETGEETFYAVLPFFHAFGLSLALGPDSPRADQPGPGTLGHTALGLPTPVSLLMPAFSLPRRPPPVTRRLPPARDAPLPPAAPHHPPTWGRQSPIAADPRLRRRA